LVWIGFSPENQQPIGMRQSPLLVLRGMNTMCKSSRLNIRRMLNKGWEDIPFLPKTIRSPKKCLKIFLWIRWAEKEFSRTITSIPLRDRGLTLLSSPYPSLHRDWGLSGRARRRPLAKSEDIDYWKSAKDSDIRHMSSLYSIESAFPRKLQSKSAHLIHSSFLFYISSTSLLF